MIGLIELVEIFSRRNGSVMTAAFTTCPGIGFCEWTLAKSLDVPPGTPTFFASTRTSKTSHISSEIIAQFRLWFLCARDKDGIIRAVIYH